MTTVGSVTSSTTKSATTASSSSNATKAKTTKKTKSDTVTSIISDIRKLTTSDKKIDELLDKFSTLEHSDEDLLKLQTALTSRQRQSDTLSNIMRSLHEMSMNVVRNMKLN